MACYGPAMEPGDRPEPDVEPVSHPHLRLVWTNPHPPAPRRPLNLAAAIEHHLSGADGLSDEDFLRAYSGGKAH